MSFHMRHAQHVAEVSPTFSCATLRVCFVWSVRLKEEISLAFAFFITNIFHAFEDQKNLSPRIMRRFRNASSCLLSTSLRSVLINLRAILKIPESARKGIQIKFRKCTKLLRRSQSTLSLPLITKQRREKIICNKLDCIPSFPLSFAIMNLTSCFVIFGRTDKSISHRAEFMVMP